jgi:hypothetical protein
MAANSARKAANQTQAVDFIHDRLFNGQFRAFVELDEFSRESLAIEVDKN